MVTKVTKIKKTSKKKPEETTENTKVEKRTTKRKNKVAKQKEEKVKIPKTKKQKLKRKHLILLIIACCLILVLIILILLTNKNVKTTKEPDDNKTETKNEIVEKEEPLQVYDENSKERPYAVMISNDGTAKKRQFGIQDAYLVYEITVEGGITRLMALFKDVNVEKIGPVRSSRHYYLDYALENDAIYAHFGWSPQAQSDISKLDIDNLNGITNPLNMYWRDNNYSSPNNAYTSTENIKETSEALDYRLTSDNYQLLNYKKNVDLSSDETFETANSVKINYSGAYVKYEYDSEKEYYLRFNSSNKHIDLSTDEQVHVKNIIILKMDNKTISGDSAGRQELYNIGTGEGYYISNGQLIEITWHKDSRKAKTIYKNKNGEEIEISDGNTFIQIQPTDYSLEVE